MINRSPQLALPLVEQLEFEQIEFSAAWSYSRRGAFEQCLRRYFFDYYSAFITDPVLLDGVVRLKLIQNRYTRCGSILHLVLKTFLRKARNGQVWSKTWTKHWAQELLKQDIEYSTSVAAGSPIRHERFGPAVLQELISKCPDGLEMVQSHGSQILKAIDGFFDNDRFKSFVNAARRTDSLIEERISLPVFDVRTSGQVDLAFNADDYAAVVDWKLGAAADDGNESLQLSYYGMWAADHYRRSAREVRVYKAHLASNDVVEFTASDRVFASARARICQDAKRMEVLQPYGESGEIEAFTPCAQAGVCRLCRYQTVCAEGRACLDA
jgi:PD-(D/E)XK nuclease superfamily